MRMSDICNTISLHMRALCKAYGLPIQEDPLARKPSKQEHFIPVEVSSHTCSHSPVP